MRSEITNFIQEALSEPLKKQTFKVTPLAGDASSRRYSRLAVENQSWVLMEWEPFVLEESPLLSVQSHFKKNHVLVPDVVSYSGPLGVILYEDLGDITLEYEFLKTRNPYGALGYYRMAMDELLKIHLIATKDKTPCIAFNYAFDISKLSWELQWMRQHFLEGLLDFATPKPVLDEEFLKLSSLLQKDAQYIQHRDYHSRNIMVYQNKVRVIDFQDARLGLVQYDLVSLLRDAYIPMPHSLEKELLDYYLHRAQADFNQSWSTEEFYYLYEIQSIQRLLKAVGSFASFWMLRKDRRYLKYIQPTMRRVRIGLEALPEFSSLHHRLSMSGAYDWSEDQL